MKKGKLTVFVCLYVVNEMTFSGYIVYNLDLLYIIVIFIGYGFVYNNQKS